MNDELLERATRAFAAETAESGLDDVRLEQTLRRLERVRRPAPDRRRTLRTLYWTLAALCVGMGAWANATGRIDEWFESEPEPPPPAAKPSAPAAPPSAGRPAPRVSEPPALVEPAPGIAAPAVAPPVTPPALPPAVPAPPRPHAPAKAPPSVKPPRPATPPPAPQDVDDVYRAAHRAHFNQQDYARALPLWDRYLELAGPEHVLLPEARFNRAIALYRLGQWAAAKRALEPFAGGEYGRYRRADAERLLEAIERQRR